MSALGEVLVGAGIVSADAVMPFGQCRFGPDSERAAILFHEEVTQKIEAIMSDPWRREKVTALDAVATYAGSVKPMKIVLVGEVVDAFVGRTELNDFLVPCIGKEVDWELFEDAVFEDEGKRYRFANLQPLYYGETCAFVQGTPIEVSEDGSS